MEVRGHGGRTEGDGEAFDALAHALGTTLSVPFVLISIVLPHGQDVVGTYQAARLPSGTRAHATPLCRQVVHGAKPVIVHDVRRRIAVGSNELAALGIAGYAGVPVLLGEAAVGAVAALERRVRSWSDQDVELLRRFAEAIASMVASERASHHERAVTALLLAIAAAASVQEMLELIARHVGWPRAQLLVVESGRMRPIAVYDVDQPGAHLDRVPAFAIAIPDRSAVVQLFAGEVAPDPGDLVRIAPSVATLASAVLARMERRAGPDERTSELETLALHDDLTGLLNRRGFYAVAGGQLAIARRNGMPGMVLFIDVDGLKGVNDRDGHSAGDSLLRLAGRVLRSTFRDADTIARVGGDEFVVFSLDATDGDLTAVTDRLSRELARANEAARATSQLRWSVGHVCFDSELVDSLDGLLVEADRRMYAVKRLTQLASSGFRHDADG